MGNTFGAHIFKRRQVGEREEVTIKLFNADGSPLDLSTPTAPEADGGFLMKEKFDGDLSAYVADATQGTLTSLNGLVVADGMLHTTDANEHTFHRPDVSYLNGTQVAKVRPTSTAIVSLVKRITDRRWVMLQYIPDMSALSVLYSTEDDNPQNLIASVGSPAYAKAPIYLALTVDGQNVYAASYYVDPESGAIPFSSAVDRLPDGVAGRLCVAGNPGLRFGGFSGGFVDPGPLSRLEEWRVKELS